MAFTHADIEKSNTLLIVLVLLVVSVGGLVEIVPLYFQRSTTEPVAGLKPYAPLQLVGRDIYVREGCYNCHSQMVRPFRAETERYGHYSVAGEFVYDRPFQWGSKRTGPDLARVGGKYSNDWQVAHLVDPRSVVPESIMPGYAFLLDRKLEVPNVTAHLETQQLVGVPYSDAMLENAAADLVAQATPDADVSGLLERYPKAVTGDIDGNPEAITEMDALVAYLQILGQMVDFTGLRAESLLQ
jgi:cytochrome c oxidase cbb3-type subunit 2